jgi:hypothetical protein
MKNRFKLALVSLVGLLGLLLFLGAVDRPYAISAESLATPTPTPAKANTPASTPAAPANTAAPAGGGKEIREKFTLSQEALKEEGKPVPFNHRTHATLNYSPDGKSVVGCVECHHTDQPKSALKPPLKTSERDVVLTMDVWRSSTRKVSECRACHFQQGAEPDGKTIPSATYPDTGKTKELDNELAYHINCNSCHDAAAKARPELKKKPGFATGSDCAKCHSGGN